MNDVDTRVRDELRAIAEDTPLRRELWDRTQQRIRVRRRARLRRMTAGGVMLTIALSAGSIAITHVHTNGRRVSVVAPPKLRPPTLTLEPSGPFYVGDTVTATLHNPPPNVPASRLRIWQCGDNDIRGSECDATDNQTWSKLADGSLQQRVVLNGSNVHGIYLAVQSSPDRTRSDIARSGRITVTPTAAEQRRINARSRRLGLHPKTTTP